MGVLIFFAKKIAKTLTIFEGKKLKSFLPKETEILMGDSHLRNFLERKHKLRNYSDSWIKIRMAS